jgi:hypothetical protein
MKDSKPCRTCGREKPLSDFRRLGRLMVERSGTGLTHGHDCKACRLAAKVRAAAEEPGAAPLPTIVEEFTQPTLSIPYSMGVDIAYDGADFVITQENNGTTHTVYMAPHVLRRLVEFGEGLAKQLPGAVQG